MCPARYRAGGSLLHCLSTLTKSPPEAGFGNLLCKFPPGLKPNFEFCSADFRLTPKAPGAVYFCCTGLGVASTGRYPASCPVKPGLSSPAAFRFCSRDHLFYLFCYNLLSHMSYTLNMLPPINSRIMEFFAISSLGTGRR